MLGVCERIDAGPQDVIVLQYPGTLGPEKYDKVCKQVKEAFGDERKVLVLEGGMSLSVLRKYDTCS